MLIDGIEVPDAYKSPEMQAGFIANYKLEHPEHANSNQPAGDPPAPVVLKEGDPGYVKPSDAFDPVKYIPIEKHQEVASKLTELEKRSKELEESLKAIPASAIDDPDLYRLNKLKAISEEKYDLFKRLKLGGDMTDIDLLVIDHISKNPKSKDNISLVKEFLTNKYGLDKNIPEPLTVEGGYTQEEVNQRASEIERAEKLASFAKMNMEQDADSLRTKFNSEFEAIELPVFAKKTPEQIEAEITTRKATWEPVVSKIVEALTVVPIFVTNKKGKPEKFMDFEVPEQMREGYKKLLIDFAASGEMPTEQNTYNQTIEKITNAFIDRFEADHKVYMYSAVAANARKMTADEYDAKYHNPSALKDNSNNNPPAVTTQEESVKKAFESRGVRV